MTTSDRMSRSAEFAAGAVFSIADQHRDPLSGQGRLPDRRPEPGEIAVDSLHKAVKMHAQLTLKRQAIIKRIHQVGLTATNPTPQVKAFGRFGGFAEQPAFGGLSKTGADAFKLWQRRKLCVVRHERASLYQRFVLRY